MVPVSRVLDHGGERRARVGERVVLDRRGRVEEVVRVPRGHEGGGAAAPAKQVQGGGRTGHLLRAGQLGGEGGRVGQAAPATQVVAVVAGGGHVRAAAHAAVMTVFGRPWRYTWNVTI